MVRVLAVNNYPSLKRFIRLKRCLEDSGALVAVCGREKCSAGYFAGFDGIALSGSPDMLSTAEVKKRYEGELDSIRDTTSAIFGVCFGHQLIAEAFGSRVVRDSRPVLGFVKTEAVASSSLFAGLASPMMLLESRHEVVESLPVGFDLIARSETSQVAAMRHRNRQLYGVQSHPERYTIANPDGKKVIANFVAALS